MDSKSKKTADKTAKALSEREFYQKAILDNIPDIAWLKDKESRFVLVNESFGRACGFKPEDLVGKTDLDIWPEDLAQRYRADDREVMNSKKRKKVEEPLADKEGKIKWIETIKTPALNEKGEVIGTIGIAHDITARKLMEERLRETMAELEIRVKVRTAELSKLNEDLHREIDQVRRVEEALKESEEKFRAIAENSIVGIGILQGDTIAYVNHSCANTFGYKPEELTGKDMFELVAPEDRKAIAEMAVKRLTGVSVPSSFEFKGIKKDGTKFNVEVSSSPPLLIGGFLSLITMTQDITERKRAAKEILEKEEFLDSVFSSIQDGISVLDKDMTIIRVNHAMEKWYKHAMPLVGKKCYQAYHGRKERCKICPTHKTLETGEEAYEVVPKIGEGNKIVGWLDLYSFPLLDSKTGKLRGVIEYVRDITKLKKLQQKQDKK